MLTTYAFDDRGNTPTNVMDGFLNMTTEQIRQAVEVGRSPMVSVCMNLTSDFNKSSIVRASNAFLGREVIMVGGRRFDRRGTVGMHHYENVLHADTMDEVFDHLGQDYTIFAVDNQPEFHSQAIYDVDLPPLSAFVYGEEQRGLDRDTITRCHAMVHIPQYGVVRSLNVAQSAAVVMSEYARRHRR